MLLIVEMRWWVVFMWVMVWCMCVSLLWCDMMVCGVWCL